MLNINKKLLLTIVIFVIMVTAVRFLWMNFLTLLDYSNPPSAKDGVFDLRGFHFNDHQTVQLNGQWEFYPSTFLITPNNPPEPDSPPAESVKINVPGTWNGSFATKDTSFRYGTYRLQILLDQEMQELFGFRVSGFGNASAVFVNGRLLAASGHPSTEVQTHQAKNLPYTVNIPSGSNRLEVIIQISDNSGKGGIFKSIRFGTIDAINERNFLLLGLQLLLCVTLFLNSLYGLILFLMGVNNKALNYFSILMILAACSVLLSGDRLIFQWLDIDYEWMVKVIYLVYTGIAALLPLLINHMFPSYGNPKLLKGHATFCMLYLLFILLSPSSYIFATSVVLLLSVLIIAVSLCVHILYRAIQEKKDVIHVLLACMCIGTNVIWSSINLNTPGNETINYPFDLIIALLAFAAFWFRRFFHATNSTKRLAEKLQLEDKRKDEFLVNTSHELRNPLQSISTMLQVILDDQTYSLHPKQKERVLTIRKVSNRLNLMLDDLIEITRLKEKSIALDKKSIRLQSVVSGVMDMIKIMLEGKPITIRVEIDDRFPAVHADENRVIQILFNLLHNAVKFTDEGSITVRVSKLHQMAEVQVEDTGIGIVEEDLPTIFQPYEQADMQSNRAGGGFGLGLSICKQLVELHDGTITADSSLGKGSLFRFTLPLYVGNQGEEGIETSPIHMEPMDMAAAAAEIQDWVSDPVYDPETTNCKLLLVDDDAINLNVFAETLKSEGYAITGVTSAEQAIAAMETERYDLIITDVMMPNVSGYELTRFIRERFNLSELPILLLTARSRTEDIITGFHAGANDYVKKPVDALELKARVRTLINLKATIDERLRIESAWLQSQIQPHFLYNTLNSIAALGVIDFEKMQKLLDEFSNYLRLSFDFKNASPVVSIERELHLVKSYVYIEQERFGKRLKVVWDIGHGINTLIPPLSIQPLVENAVMHGLMNRSQGGTVYIRIHNKTDYVQISVEDDGEGIDPNKLAHLLNHQYDDQVLSGVGLKNIHRRLKQQFGTGLIIHSSPETGTEVSFEIPIKRE
ncbi:MAG: response regulator [Paenibacillaceae bacterium]|nr:response regulator [Paenibacillaceae bacterium]